MGKPLPVRALRFLFGLLFVTTAVGKLLDNRGFADVLGNYRLFPTQMLLPLALGVSLGELYLGCRIFLDQKLERLAWITAGIQAGYLILALVTLYRGIELANCGCFGVFLARPLTWMTPVEDAVLGALALWFVRATKGD